MKRAVWVTPAFAVLAAVAAYPLIAAAWLSLHRSILIFGEERFIGGTNFRFLLEDGRFWSALGNTVYFVLVAVSIELVLGLAIALLLDSEFPGRAWVRAAVLIPWAIPTVVSAKMWAWLFHADQGFIIPGGASWLGSPGWAMHAAILVDVWKTTPFVALLLLAGLQTIPQELTRAARVDGARAWRRFISITLPMLAPTIAVTTLLRGLDAFRVFDAVYVLTEGGPANTTETLSIYAYKTLMRSGDFGYGSTIAVSTFICVALIAGAYLAALRKRIALT